MTEATTTLTRADLSVSPWAPFRSAKAAIKPHTLLDLRGAIPSFIHISDGNLHDVKALILFVPEPGAFYVMDRVYLDFKRLYLLHNVGNFFVTRAKRNLDARRVVYRDPESGRKLVFLTDHFALPPLMVCALYRSRWQVELFFRWIKRHLRIKRFYGTSENAVKTQFWIAVSFYVLVAIVANRLALDVSLHALLQILSVALFEKTSLRQALAATEPARIETMSDNQLILFES